MKPRTRRVLTGITMILLAMIIGLFIAGWQMLRSSVPPTSGTIEVPGLNESVDITFDSLGVPQIWAADEHDALFALGWQHAADRMFQMDLMRRVSQGRLSEMLGDVMLNLDVQQRRVGHSRLARKALETLSEKSRARLQAYADGINAYIEYGGSPTFEFRLLPVSFEHWTVFDCLALLSFESWYSDALQNNDMFYIHLAEQGQTAALAKLPLGYPSWGLSTVTRENARARSALESMPAPSGLSARFQREVARDILRTGLGAFAGITASNVWAISPEKSASGRAMLASDPHLETTRLPEFWYIAGLHTRDDSLDVVGVTIAGLPFVVMGHNRQAAWAFTAGGVDITDYYSEKIDPSDSGLYLLRIDSTDGRVNEVWDTLQVIHDSLEVAGQDSLAHATYRITRRGPIIPEAGNDTLVISEHWAGYDTDFNRTLNAAFDLCRSADFETFRRNVTSFGALNANWMYADSGGTIGYQLGTPVPIRGSAEYRLPLPGARLDLGWQGYEPLDRTPHAENPPEGWLANCNNKPGGPIDIPGTYFADRILRLTELLNSKNTFTVADMERFQMDRIDAFLLRWKPDLVRLVAGLDDTTGAAQALADWTGATDTGSYATAIAVTFVRELGKALFQDEFGDDANGFGSYTIDAVFHDTLSPWIDDTTTAGHVETRDEIGRRALKATLESINGRKWGQVQTLTMRHPMAMVSILSSLLDLSYGPWPWGGTASTLDASYNFPRGDGTVESMVGPSWRCVVDFADVDGIGMDMPGGMSGNPMSPHFFDFNPLWRTGARSIVPLSRDKVDARKASTLVLEAKKDEDGKEN